MIVWHFNTYLEGGAAYAARTIHEDLLAVGVDSVFWYKSATGAPPESRGYTQYAQESRPGFFRRLPFFSDYRQKSKRWLEIRNARKAGFDIFNNVSLPITTPFPTRTGEKSPDIVHLHWIADWIDYPSFFGSMPANIPIVWTCHDMAPFTGGCHYSWDCDKYKSLCSECPQLEDSFSEHVRQNHQAQLKFLSRRKIHVVADSYWIENCARDSSTFGKAISFTTVHYGVDSRSYRPMDKALARCNLRIPQDAFVLCFSAANASDRRKGLEFLLRSLNGLSLRTPIWLLIMGGNPVAFDIHNRQVTIKYLGFIASPVTQCKAYNAADVFVIPSLEEAFGQTCLQAMACGLPCIGFAVGGIPDMIRHNENGFLVKRGDTTELADFLVQMAEDQTLRHAMGKSSRAAFLRHFKREKQCAEYFRLYKTILG